MNLFRVIKTHAADKGVMMPTAIKISLRESANRAAGVDPIASSEVYRVIERPAHDDRHAILLVDQDIKRALAVADYVDVIRNGNLLAERTREIFGADTAALVSHWLSASAGP